MAHVTYFLFSFIYSLSYPFHPSPSQPCPPHLGIGEKGVKKSMNKGTFNTDVAIFWQNEYSFFRDMCTAASSSSRRGNPLWGCPFQPEPPSLRIERFGGSQASVIKGHSRRQEDKENQGRSRCPGFAGFFINGQTHGP